MTPVGKGRIQAVAASKLGGDVIFICKVGNDDLGQKALGNYDSAGIDISSSIQDLKHPTDTALSTVDKNGENAIPVAS